MHCLQRAPPLGSRSHLRKPASYLSFPCTSLSWCCLAALSSRSPPSLLKYRQLPRRLKYHNSVQSKIRRRQRTRGDPPLAGASHLCWQQTQPLDDRDHLLPPPPPRFETPEVHPTRRHSKQVSAVFYPLDRAPAEHQMTDLQNHSRFPLSASLANRQTRNLCLAHRD